MRARDARKESAIRKKALEHLARDGLDGFSMQRLARAARVSPGTLYIYYRDRDDLLFQLYQNATEVMVVQTFDGFDSNDSHEKGLRIQWRNRVRFLLEHPLEAQFLEHMRHSPYHDRFAPRMTSIFTERMRPFVQNAIARKELAPMPRELFWSLVFAPLYQLVRFHAGDFFLSHAEPTTPTFRLTDDLIDSAVSRIVRSLRP